VFDYPNSSIDECSKTDRLVIDYRFNRLIKSGYYAQIQYPCKLFIIIITYRSNKSNQNNRSLIDQTPERV
jgi:hypothetical protein